MGCGVLLLSDARSVTRPEQETFMVEFCNGHGGDVGSSTLVLPGD
jgi:hypothetical protein